MSEIIDAESKEKHELLPKDMISVIQIPEIEFKKLRAFSKQVESEISALNLDKMVATPDNLKSIKSKRTDLRKSQTMRMVMSVMNDMGNIAEIITMMSP